MKPRRVFEAGVLRARCRAPKHGHSLVVEDHGLRAEHLEVEAERLLGISPHQPLVGQTHSGTQGERPCAIRPAAVGLAAEGQIESCASEILRQSPLRGPQERGAVFPERLRARAADPRNADLVEDEQRRRKFAARQAGPRQAEPGPLAPRLGVQGGFEVALGVVELAACQREFACRNLGGNVYLGARRALTSKQGTAQSKEKLPW